MIELVFTNHDKAMAVKQMGVVNSEM